MEVKMTKKLKKCRGGGNFNHDDNSSSLSDDDDNILCEILSRLSAKTLMRFKCVCKRWQSIIQQDPYFIDLHHSRARPSLLLVGRMEDHPDGSWLSRWTGARKSFYLPADLSFESNKYGSSAASAVAHASTNSFGKDHIMLGPVNGLICFYIDFAVRIYNISTREVTPWIKLRVTKKEIEEDERPIFDFGYDPSTKKHKVICVRVVPPRKTKKSFINTKQGKKFVRICEVLTVGVDRSWRMIDDVPTYDIEGCSVYANGSIYWRKLKPHETSPFKRNTTSRVKENPEIIMAFDVGSEKFRVIHIPNIVQPPKCGVPWCVNILEVDGHVALLHRMSDRTVKLWTFHDDDDDGKKKRNSLIEETITLPFCWNETRGLMFWSVAGTDQIIVHSRSQGLQNFISLHSYNRKKKTFKKIEISGIPTQTLNSCFRIKTFAESLYPVQKAATTEP